MKRLFKAFKTLAMAGVIVGLALLAALWLEHRTGITLPAPTGSFAVGLAIYDWTDAAHADALAPVAGARRELLVRIWYPAAAQSAATADYLPAAARAASEPAGLMGLLTRDLTKVRAHSIPGADVSPRQPPYPVVIMRAGASSEVWNYSTLAEDLASHGYVVAGLDAPYRTWAVVFPDGRVMRRTPENNPEHCEEVAGVEQERCMDKLLTAWTADMSFVLDRLEALNSAAAGQFAGRLDLTRVGAFGHSFGGAQAAQFCHDDARCKAGIDVDGAPFGSVVSEGIHRPFLFLLSDHGNESDPESAKILADIQSIYAALPPGGRLRIAIRGANHFLFSDDGALLKSHIVMRTLRLLGMVGIDGRRQLAVTAYCVRSFFDAYLKGATVSRPEISPALYPEIRVIE